MLRFLLYAFASVVLLVCAVEGGASSSTKAPAADPENDDNTSSSSFFVVCDVNQDKIITRDELNTCMVSLKNTEYKQFAELMTEGGLAASMLATLDSNNDGQISLAEYLFSLEKQQKPSKKELKKKVTSEKSNKRGVDESGSNGPISSAADSAAAAGASGANEQEGDVVLTTRDGITKSVSKEELFKMMEGKDVLKSDGTLGRQADLGGEGKDTATAATAETATNKKIEIKQSESRDKLTKIESATGKIEEIIAQNPEMGNYIRMVQWAQGMLARESGHAAGRIVHVCSLPPGGTNPHPKEEGNGKNGLQAGKEKGKEGKGKESGKVERKKDNFEMAGTNLARLFKKENFTLSFELTVSGRPATDRVAAWVDEAPRLGRKPLRTKYELEIEYNRLLYRKNGLALLNAWLLDSSGTKRVQAVPVPLPRYREPWILLTILLLTARSLSPLQILAALGALCIACIFLFRPAALSQPQPQSQASSSMSANLGAKEVEINNRSTGSGGRDADRDGEGEGSMSAYERGGSKKAGVSAAAGAAVVRVGERMGGGERIDSDDGGEVSEKEEEER